MAKVKLKVDEAKVKEISKSPDLSQYTHDELQRADLFIKNYALTKLAQKMTNLNVPKELGIYISLMACAHYGSMETDNLLMTNQCYPEWL